MSIRMRRPETVKLEMSHGDWLLVKKYLTAGEQRTMFARMLREETDRINPIKVGVSRIQAYLLDWSFEDADGKPLNIRDQPENVLASALDVIDAEAFVEVLQVIDAHITAMTEQREKEKASPFGETGTSPTSPSVAG